MRRMMFCFSVVFCVFFVISCEPQPQLSPMQIRNITTKLFDVDYENTFRAALTVLQDQGYVIKMTDMNSGLINATIDRKTSTGSQVLQALFVGHIADKGSQYELSCMLNKINENTTEIRMNIHQTKYGQASKFSGTSEQNAYQIYDPLVYKELFDQIGVEVQRRIAINIPNSISNQKTETSVPPQAQAQQKGFVWADEIIAVKIANKSYEKGVDKEHIWFDASWIPAKLKKPARSVKGILNFCDLFGVVKYRLEKTIDFEMRPKELITERGIGFTYNTLDNAHNWMKETDLKNMTFKFQVTNILYIDGEREDF